MVEKNHSWKDISLPYNNKLIDARYYEFQDVLYDYGSIKKFPLQGSGIERFLPLLPIEKIRVELAGELGDTPLSRLLRFGRKVGFANIWVKHEELNPTGSFKDRESCIITSAAIERGIKDIYIVSSGNAAVSTSAYAQKADIRCTCYIPEKTSASKQSLIKLFGANLVVMSGGYEDIYRRIVNYPPEGWNVTAGQNQLRTEGNKTIAYEIFYQLGNVPDTILVPSGNGSCLAGLWKGFKELYYLNQTKKLPQMISIQVKGASPLLAAFREDKDVVKLDSFKDSIAEGIVAQESYSSPKAIRSLLESGGYVIEVTDQEIIDALKVIIQMESIVPEPTSASVYAAVSKLTIDPQSLVVCINTGSGMKMSSEIASLLNLV